MKLSLSHDEFQEVCDRWCKDVYERNPHGGLEGKSPFLMATEWKGRTRRIPDERALDVLLAPAPGKQGERTVRSEGVRVEGRYYIAPEFGRIVGNQATVKLDERDAGLIYVFRRGKFLCVAQCPALAEVSRQEVTKLAKGIQKKHRGDYKKQLREAAKAAKAVKEGEIAKKILDQHARESAKVAAFRGPSDPHNTQTLEESAQAVETAGRHGNKLHSVSEPEVNDNHEKDFHEQIRAGLEVKRKANQG